MSARVEKGRALFYTRDSGGRHEMTPAEYIGWAQRKAVELELSFDGTPQAIGEMIRTGQARRGDIFLDYGVAGHLLSREGLDAMTAVAQRDRMVSHVLIPRRDRLARPDDPVDGVLLEKALREAGLTLVFMDRVCPPLKKGQRRDIGELITGLIDYEKSGKDRRDLAEKMIYAQLQLARRGYSTGGRAPYGFRRWLAKEDGTKVRQLADGEYVRMAGHHVVWLPGPEEELAVIRRILTLLETMPACRVAATLTAEKVPTPDHGRSRTDHGVRHPTSGVWHQPTVVNIARNPLLAAVALYGRRSMGDQARLSPTGPRSLEDADFRGDGQPKVIRNPADSLIRQPVAVPFDPVIDPRKQQALLQTLDARAGTQRGKPRSHDPAGNPLGCRIIDMNCTWPMYRQPYNGSFRYLCGLYQQSHAARCAHNHIDGPHAVRFVLGCLRQQVLSPRLMQKLEQRLVQRARQEHQPDQDGQEAARQAQLAELKRKLERVNRNLGLAETDEQLKAMLATQKQLREQHDALETLLARGEQTRPAAASVQAEVDKALAALGRLTDLAGDDSDYAAIGELFRQVNVRLFLRFDEVQQKKRTVTKVAGGVLTFGSAAPPIQPYEGPTGRRRINCPATSGVTGPGDRTIPDQSCASGLEGNSSGNVSRGERI